MREYFGFSSKETVDSANVGSALDLEKQKEEKYKESKATQLIVCAWIIEICAAGIGFFFAYTTGEATRKYLAQDTEAFIGDPNISVTLAMLPFMIIGVVELTKIPLAFAAYNAGPSRISRAIKKNKEEGKPTDFWSLKLPKETTAYVPKLLVLCELIKDPSSYGVVLPSIANRQYFVKVTIPGQVDLLQAADLAGMTPEAIYELNPGFNQWATDPGGPHYLLLPAGISDRFLIKLSSLSEVELVQWDRYQIKRGDNLSKIARNHSIEVAVLKEINQLEDDLIYAGKEIMVPRGPAWVKTFVPRSKTYLVVKGDTFWGISKQFGVSIQDLTLWNDLNLRKPLQIGQKIKIFSRYESVRGKTPNKKTKTLLYPVKVGDTLSRIGSRFGIKASDIQKWNELKSPQLIYPGQVLKIILNNGVGN